MYSDPSAEDRTPREEVVLRKKHDHHHHDNDNDDYEEYDEQDDGDYENIDAHLDEDEQRHVRRSDYLNWVYVESDEEDGDVSPITGRNPPSVKLHNHPALKKSQSSHEMESPSMIEALALKKQFEQHLQNLKSSKEGVRPKNRAPPPPPGSKSTSKQKGDRSPNANRASYSSEAQDSLQTSSERGHKRSQSDQRVVEHSEREQEGERRPVRGGESRGGEGGRGGPVAAASALAPRLQQAQRMSNSPQIHSKNPHRSKPPGSAPQFQRANSPRTSNQSHNPAPSGLPPPPTYAPPPAPTVTSSSSSSTPSSSSGRPSGAESAQRTPPVSSSHQQQSRRPNPPRTGGKCVCVCVCSIICNTLAAATS